jgi:NTE family protein
LVLGGGGSTGHAWLIGVVAGLFDAGLFDAGLDLTELDLTIGTSAGSTAAAQLAGATPAELLAAILAAAHQPPSAPVGSDRGRAPRGRRRNTWRGSRPSSTPPRMRPVGAAGCGGAREGCGVRRLQPDPVARYGRRSAARPALAAAIAARHGRRRLFRSAGGVRRAQRSRHGGRRRRQLCLRRLRLRDRREAVHRRRLPTSSENADLAAGYGRVLVLSPLGDRSRTPLDWGTHLAAQVDELRAGGSRVETIVPNSDSEHMFGANAMDLSLRPPAARAGYGQGRALAEQLTEFWR